MEMKEGWKFASRDSGEPSVMIHGIIWMLRWFADNLGLEQQVKLCSLKILSMYMYDCSH